MQHIVVDLEFLPVSDKEVRKILRNEIIEIGAVKLDDNYNLIDTFNIFVKPAHSKLDKYFSSLCSITQKDIENAPCFAQALEQFSEWIGYERYRIYEWSENDKHQIEDECFAKAPGEEYIELCSKHWYDLQRIYGRVAGLYRPVSLENALSSLGFEFEGTMHRADWDALNTAKILQLFKNSEEMKERIEAIRKVTAPVEHRSTLGDIFGEMLTLAQAS